MTSTDERVAAPIVVVILTKNEEANITACVVSAALVGAPIVVVDSASHDRTVQLAVAAGADVVPFEWNGIYPKKKQCSINYVQDRFDTRWILLLDADERISVPAADFIRSVSKGNGPSEVVAYRFPVEYRFAGGHNRYGFQAKKVALLRPQHVRFGERDDLHIPGSWEVEGHYQPDADGPIALAPVTLLHDDEDLLHDWVDRHNRYSDWSAHMRYQASPPDERPAHSDRTKQLFERLPFQGVMAFLHSFVVRRGFLDGSAGFDFAVARGFYYWLGAAKRRELHRREQRS